MSEKDAFISSVKRYVENGVRPKNDVFILKNTPEILQQIGYKNLEFTFSTYVIDKAISGKHKGEITKEQLYSTLSEFYSPLFVFKSKKDSQSRGKSKIVMTDVVASNKELYSITFYPNTMDKYAKNKNRHIVTSIHKRVVIAKNKTNIIEQEIKAGNCEYIDDIKLESIKKANWRFHT